MDYSDAQRREQFGAERLRGEQDANHREGETDLDQEQEAVLVEPGYHGGEVAQSRLVRY